MTQSVHRKNLSKQFTCVDDDTRSIFHWYRPGEPLPQLIYRPCGQRLLLTQEHIDAARKDGRCNLVEIPKAIATRLVLTDKQNDTFMRSEGRITGKDCLVVDLPDPKVSIWDHAKSWAFYGSIAAGSAMAANEIVKLVQQVMA